MIFHILFETALLLCARRQRHQDLGASKWPGRLLRLRWARLALGRAKLDKVRIGLDVFPGAEPFGARAVEQEALARQFALSRVHMALAIVHAGPEAAPAPCN